MKTVSLLDSITATHDNFDATANARIKIDGQEEEAKCCVATNPCVEKTETLSQLTCRLRQPVLRSFARDRAKCTRQPVTRVVLEKDRHEHL